MSLRPFFCNICPSIAAPNVCEVELAAHTSGQRMCVQSTVQDPSTIVNLGVHTYCKLSNRMVEGLGVRDYTLTP